jgi:hypothetical protein
MRRIFLEGDITTEKAGMKELRGSLMSGYYN